MNKVILISTVIGVVHATTIAYIHFAALPVTRVGDTGLVAVVIGNGLTLAGLVLVGAVAFYLLVQYGLVLAFAVAVWFTWNSVSDVVIGQGPEPFTTFYYDPITVLLALLILVGIGAMEFVVRKQLGVFEPGPIF